MAFRVERSWQLGELIDLLGWCSEDDALVFTHMTRIAEHTWQLYFVHPRGALHLDASHLALVGA